MQSTSVMKGDELKRRVLAARASVKAKLKQLKRRQQDIQFAYKPLETIIADTLNKHSSINKVKTEIKEEPKVVHKKETPYADEAERSLRKQHYELMRQKYAPKASTSKQPSFFSTPKNVDRMQPQLEEEIFETNDEEEFIEEPEQELDISMIPEHSLLEYFNQIHPLPREYIEGRLRNTEKGTYDDNYVHHDLKSDKILFGNTELKFSNGNSPNFTIDGYEFPGTRGIFELIFKSHPNVTFITDQDKLYYGLLIRSTNANKINFDPHGKQIGNRGKKYLNFVKPSLDVYDNQVHQGTGMEYNTKHIEYKYWDDPNELVDRLRLLIASKSSGNNSHNNEIISIIEELKERRLIY